MMTANFSTTHGALALLKQVGLVLLLLPVYAIIGPLCLAIVVWSLPAILCSRFRAVRWLLISGLLYYPLVVAAMAWGFSMDWWSVVALSVVFMLSGNWLLPDVGSYFAHPTARNALYRAIAFVEAQDGPAVAFGGCRIVRREPGRTLVWVATGGVVDRSVASGREFALTAAGDIEEHNSQPATDCNGLDSA